MGTISAARLGGISLIVGPLVATVLYVILFMILGSNTDPADFEAVGADVMARSNAERAFLLIPPIGIILALYGMSVLHGAISKNEALFGLGLVMFRIAVVATIIGWGLVQAIPWLGGAGWPPTVAMSQGITTYGWMIGSVGLMLMSCAVACNREGIDQILAYVVSIVMLVVVIFSIIAILDGDQLEISELISGISYIVITVWSITLGLGLLKKA